MHSASKFHVSLWHSASMIRSLLVWLIFGCAVSQVLAADWPQFLAGPTRNGVYAADGTWQRPGQLKGPPVGLAKESWGRVQRHWRFQGGCWCFFIVRMTRRLSNAWMLATGATKWTYSYPTRIPR